MITREEADKVLGAICLVCGWCDYVPEDFTGIDPCAGCKVVETADRMWDIVNGEEQS